MLAKVARFDGWQHSRWVETACSKAWARIVGKHETENRYLQVARQPPGETTYVISGSGEPARDKVQHSVQQFIVRIG